MYDARIGRWLSTDPAGQFASPYEGMGNNPVMGSDPTGADTTMMASTVTPEKFKDYDINDNDVLMLKEVNINLSKRAIYNGFDNQQAYRNFAQIYAYNSSLYTPDIEGVQGNVGLSAKGLVSFNVGFGFVRGGKHSAFFITPSVNFGANSGGGGIGGDFSYFWGYKNDPNAKLSDFGGGSESYQANAIMFSGGMSKSVDPATGAKTTSFNTYNYGVGLGAGLNYSKGRTVMFPIN